jgi:hypothetical protein
VPLDAGRIGLSGLKKPEPRFRTAGEGGMFLRVSIARSDKDGRGFRRVSLVLSGCSSNSSAPTSGNISSSPLNCDWSSSRSRAYEDFLNSASSLAFRSVCSFVGL